jgi:DNA-binding response OmpR family regulator
MSLVGFRGALEKSRRSPPGRDPDESTGVAQEAPNAVGIPSPARNDQSTIRTGDLVVHLETRVAAVDGKPVRLTAKEYSILKVLSLQQGATVTQEMLLGHLYGGKAYPRRGIIKVFVCHLRKKLAKATGGKLYVETDWGRGYRLCDPAQIPLPPST